jgi:hypothetical protein
MPDTSVMVCACGRRVELTNSSLPSVQAESLAGMLRAGGHDPDECSRWSLEQRARSAERPVGSVPIVFAAPPPRAPGEYSGRSLELLLRSHQPPGATPFSDPRDAAEAYHRAGFTAQPSLPPPFTVWKDSL